MSSSPRQEYTNKALDLIIWAEDDYFLRESFSRLMIEAKVPSDSIIMPWNGPELVRIAREHAARCALIFTDYRMPNEGDGIEAIAEIRGFYFPPRPIFLVSNNLKKRDESDLIYAQALKAGATDCYGKVGSAKYIVGIIRQYCPHLLIAKK